MAPAEGALFPVPGTHNGQTWAANVYQESQSPTAPSVLWQVDRYTVGLDIAFFPRTQSFIRFPFPELRDWNLPCTSPNLLRFSSFFTIINLILSSLLDDIFLRDFLTKTCAHFSFFWRMLCVFNLQVAYYHQ